MKKGGEDIHNPFGTYCNLFLCKYLKHSIEIGEQGNAY